MPLQNRVTPFGEIVVSAARGTLMGNRGCLHDAERRLTGRRWTTRAWVTCALSFNGRRRQLMTPGFYTELFFLDEATALAAGHRPCAECRRSAYRSFKERWAEGAGLAIDGLAVAEIDRTMHADRLDATRRQRTSPGRVDGLPAGTMVAVDGAALLLWDGVLRPWRAEGYGEPLSLPADTACDVLTPRSTVAALRAGYRPAVHDSARAGPLS